MFARLVKEYGVDAVFVGSDWKGTPAWEQYQKESLRMMVKYWE